MKIIYLVYQRTVCTVSQHRDCSFDFWDHWARGDRIGPIALECTRKNRRRVEYVWCTLWLLIQRQVQLRSSNWLLIPCDRLSNRLKLNRSVNEAERSYKNQNCFPTCQFGTVFESACIAFPASTGLWIIKWTKPFIILRIMPINGTHCICCHDFWLFI